MRTKMIVALVSVLAALGPMGSASSFAAPAPVSTVRMGIQIDIGALEALTEDLRAERSYLLRNRNRAAWRHRFNRVDGLLAQAEGGWSGSAASQIRALRKRFAADVYAVPPNFDDGIAVLNTLIAAFQNVIDAYTGGGGGGCGNWCRSA